MLQELRTHLTRDRARTKAFPVSELGLVEMTRQRGRPSLYQTQTEPCPTCSGTGRIFTPETLVRRLERAARRASSDGKERALLARVHPEVALYVLEEEPAFTRNVEKQLHVQVTLRDDPLMRPDEMRLIALPSQQDVTSRYAVE